MTTDIGALLPHLADAGFLLLRCGVGLLFLNAAWACVKDKAARDWTTSETALVFKTHSRLFAMAGIAVMGVGGAAILLGIFGRVAGLALAVFLIGGAKIHFVQRQRAFELQKRIVDGPGGATLDAPVLTELAWSASLGHYSSALKNLTLIAVCLFIALVGTGPLSIIDLDHWLQ